MDNSYIRFRDTGQICNFRSHITYNTHSMKCTLTIYIMIHIINCQQLETERYFAD